MITATYTDKHGRDLPVTVLDALDGKALIKAKGNAFTEYHYAQWLMVDRIWVPVKKVSNVHITA